MHMEHCISACKRVPEIYQPAYGVAIVLDIDVVCLAAALVL